MNQFEKKVSNELKIEIIKSPEGNEASYCPERGGIITSLKLQGKEILYLDEETFKNKDVNVKGGIPILFPNAGPIPTELKTEELKDLKQHGFARDFKWTNQPIKNGFKEVLVSNTETKKAYPYDFEISISGYLNKDGSFTIIQMVKNLDNKKEIPISSGLHPYFKVQSEEKKNIKFKFEGGEEIANQIEKWSKGEAVFMDNPNTPMEIFIPNLGTLVLIASEEYGKIVFWSKEDQDYICIEVFMKDPGGIIKEPEKVRLNNTHIATFNILLKENKIIL